MDRKFYTVGEAAVRLQASPRVVQRWCKLLGVEKRRDYVIVEADLRNIAERLGKVGRKVDPVRRLEVVLAQVKQIEARIQRLSARRKKLLAESSVLGKRGSVE